MLDVEIASCNRTIVTQFSQKWRHMRLWHQQSSWRHNSIIQTWSRCRSKCLTTVQGILLSVRKFYLDEISPNMRSFWCSSLSGIRFDDSLACTSGLCIRTALHMRTHNVKGTKSEQISPIASKFLPLILRMMVETTVWLVLSSFDRDVFQRRSKVLISNSSTDISLQIIF